jgi:predicted secreted protein
MIRIIKAILAAVLLNCVIAAQAQPAIQTSGALIIVPAFGEVKHPNDEARVTLMIEEHDKDKSAAASRVNQKMKQGVDIVKREDPQAKLKTRGYYTYPVYPEDQPRPYNKARQPVSWRVGQYLEVITTNIDGLPGTVAAAQRILALNGLYFGLTDATRKKVDEKQIAVTYINLTERIAAVAKAMGRNPSDAILDTVDFEGSGAYVQQSDAAPRLAMSAKAQESAPVDEPSFEPGETTLRMQVVGKVKFK